MPKQVKSRRSMRAIKAAQVAKAMAEVVAGVQVTYANGEIELRAFASVAEADKFVEVVRPMAQGDPEDTGILAVEVLDAAAVKAVVERQTASR